MPRTEHTSPLDKLDARSPEGRIVGYMRERGDVSPVDIASGTSLARSTISVCLAELRRAGIVVEIDRPPNSARGVGRPTSTFALNPQAGTCVGLHLGLNGIRVLVADVSHAILHKADIEIGLDYRPHQAVDVARKAIGEAYQQIGLSRRTMLGVGVSVAGPVAPDGHVQNASIVPTWSGIHIGELFEQTFNKPVFADNESNCAALAELLWGAAAGQDDFVYIKIDIGLGGAIVVNRQVLRGIAGGGGEFGHISLDPNGEKCRCGNRGCLELSASFRSTVERFSRRRRRVTSIDDIIAGANKGDAESVKAVVAIAEAAGHGLGIVGSILNPRVVVVGGHGIAAGPLLFDRLRQSYERHTLLKSASLKEEYRLTVRQAQFPIDGSLMGAVALVLRGEPLRSAVEAREADT